MRAPYRRVDLEARDWRLEDVKVALAFPDRLAGLHRARGRAVMIRTRSVHTFTVRGPLRAIALDGAGRVLRTAIVQPRRIFGHPDAAWIIEWDPNVPPPREGSRIRIVASCADVRNARRVRHTDREPR